MYNTNYNFQNMFSVFEFRQIKNSEIKSEMEFGRSVRIKINVM